MNSYRTYFLGIFCKRDFSFAIVKTGEYRKDVEKTASGREVILGVSYKALLEKVISLSLGRTTDMFSCACSMERQRIPTSLTWKSGLISID